MRYADSLMEFLSYVSNRFSFTAFKNLFLSLTFDILIIMCLNVYLFGFILFGILLSLWICKSVSFPIFREVLAIIPSNMISASFLLSFPPGSSLNWALVHLILSHKTLKVSPIYFLFFCIYVSFGEFQVLVFEFTDLFFSLIQSVVESL